MGNCVNGVKDIQGNLRCHIVTYKPKNNNRLIDFNSDMVDFDTTNVLLTKSGYLLIDIKRQAKLHLYKEFVASEDTLGLPVVKLQLNDGAGEFPDQLLNISSSQSNFGNAIWQLLNFEKNNLSRRGVTIEEGDVYKLGMQIIRFKILKTNTDGRSLRKSQISLREASGHIKSMIELQQDGHEAQHNISGSVIIKESELLCRICLEQETPQNPFHNLCICYKRMPTHLSCLKIWLHKNCKVQQYDHITIFDATNISCEVCGTPFARSTSSSGLNESIFEPMMPEGVPYALIEVYEIEDASTLKAYVLIDLSKNTETTIGTNSDNDIVFKNASVSRKHCLLKYNKGALRLIDNHSRHGTFKLVDSYLQIQPKKNLLLEVAKYLIEIHPYSKKPCSCVKEKRTKHLLVNPYEIMEPSPSLAARNVKTENNVDATEEATPIGDANQNKLDDMAKHKPVTLDYIPEIDSKYEESYIDSKMNTLKSNNLATTLFKNQLSKLLDKSMVSIDNLTEPILNNTVKDSVDIFRETLREQNAINMSISSLSEINDHELRQESGERNYTEVTELD